MSVSLASLYITKLLVMGCQGHTGIDDPEIDCPASVIPHTYTGLSSKAECDKFIRSREFDPVDYLPGYDTYMVQCQPQD